MHSAGQWARSPAAKNLFAWAGVLVWISWACALHGADLEEVRKQFISGQYSNCIRACEQAIADREYSEEWRLLLVQSLLATGRYTNALGVINASLDRYASSVRLRVLARDVFLQNGRKDRADALLQEINYLAGSRTWAFRNAPDLVALGKTALLLGADPRRVLDNFFDRAKKTDPDCRDVYLASGQVALDKNDFQLASKIFVEGLKRSPKDPDLHYGLARAFAPSDRRQMLDSLETALEYNTNHVPSFLLLVDHLIDGEEDEEAEKTLQKALTVNPWHPEAWAFRAVLRHLANDSEGETQSREKALQFWESNPAVDHLIGKKLSQKYRFAEGASCQRQALSFDPKFLPAKIQLAQDLLRLGEEKEGWKLADEVHEEDGYDVAAYNLVTLHESMSKFQTLTNEDFIVRMTPREAGIYGGEVLKLLQQARHHLCEKYGLTLEGPTIVEIFDNQKDFGVRTFGMPHNPGFLGVCFGHVVTANSPASQAAHAANWKAVLWHEFCHVVTLQMTRNKMPRWLSEGISVYEELQANPIWGQTMNSRYREMVLGKDLTPVSDLSAAFLIPKTDLHLQFAYYESSLVVEFLVKQFGLESLKKILRDLADGVPINEAIATHTASLEQIEEDFAAFARDRAERLAPALDWEKPRPAELVNADLKWLSEHATNFYVLNHLAKKLVREKKWKEAKVPLQELTKLYPSQTGSDSAYALLAEVHRNLGETNLEREALSKLAALDADASDAFLRLMELYSMTSEWNLVATNAERYLAVNPLVPQPYRYLAQASEATDQSQRAIDAYRTLLRLEPPDPAEAHYRLGRLLHQAGDAAAKRHVLQALEEAPRFREAHRLLLEIDRETKTSVHPDSTFDPASPSNDPKP
jgi:tetratricopeptide (TPR) repeat protein